jgi:hypothetical protein
MCGTWQLIVWYTPAESVVHASWTFSRQVTGNVLVASIFSCYGLRTGAPSCIYRGTLVHLVWTIDQENIKSSVTRDNSRELDIDLAVGVIHQPLSWDYSYYVAICGTKNALLFSRRSMSPYLKCSGWLDLTARSASISGVRKCGTELRTVVSSLLRSWILYVCIFAKYDYIVEDIFCFS